MTIEKIRDEETLTVALTGRLDTMTVSELSAAMEDAFSGVQKLIYDLSGLDYISSAGLRELFRSKKKMSGVQGEMIIRGANEDLMEVFEITGFVDLLDFEE
ncbi:MAG: STAS domain-containing protein [Lachnospiraceae bacterium]|nr:STAS domain-containing protein [Lachnospiraceae bacterium]